MTYLEVLSKVIDYLGLITMQLTTIADELAKINGSVKSNNEVHCDCTDDNIVHVGDEIYSELTDSKAVVQRIDTWHRYECFTDNGAQFIIDTETFNDYWVKTGKNYPQITEILKQMKEG